MSIPVPLAWVLLALAFFTAGILRHSHDRILASPFVSPLVGSLLFAGIVLILLVAARERRLGAARGHGVRLGSLTPILLMLLVEKWVSLGFDAPLFSALTRGRADDAQLDAQFRAFSGAALLLLCVIFGFAFRPAGRRTWFRARPGRWLPAAAGTLVVVGASYLLLAAASAALGAGFRLAWPAFDALWLWILGSQALRAIAEEGYYRGLLLAEMERLAPHLGARGESARRWAALLPTAALFSLEHMIVAPHLGQLDREIVFTFSLGLLLGILVLATNNLHFAAGVHAYINWLLLGAAPRLVDPWGQPALPPGTYVGLTLILAFVLAFVVQNAGLRRTTAERLSNAPR